MGDGTVRSPLGWKELGNFYSKGAWSHYSIHCIVSVVPGEPSPASLSGSKHAKPTPVAYQY